MRDHPQPPSALPATGGDRRDLCLCLLASGLALGCGPVAGPDPVKPTPPSGPGVLTTSDTKAQLLAAPDGTARDYRNLGNFLLLKDTTGIYAMTTVCTHMGCTVGLPVGSKITCPCHGSQYDLSGGNLLGPADRPLVHFAVSEPTPGAFLVVDTTQTVAASVRLG
jgi:cytochrome b6-f complex iron-sulfur subunit